MKRASMLLVLLLALTVVVAACGGGGGGDQQNNGGGGGAVSEEVIMTDYAFDPQDLTFNQGDKVTLTIKNEGSTAHDFTVEALDVSSGQIAVGDSAQVEIPTDQPGEYEVVCTVPGHKELGMVGTLTIK